MLHERAQARATPSKELAALTFDYSFRARGHNASVGIDGVILGARRLDFVDKVAV